MELGTQSEESFSGWGWTHERGQRCLAICPDDGLEYPAVIQSFCDNLYEVTFDEDGTTSGISSRVLCGSLLSRSLLVCKTACLRAFCPFHKFTESFPTLSVNLRATARYSVNSNDVRKNEVDHFDGFLDSDLPLVAMAAEIEPVLGAVEASDDQEGDRAIIPAAVIDKVDGEDYDIENTPDVSVDDSKITNSSEESNECDYNVEVDSLPSPVKKNIRRSRRESKGMGALTTIDVTSNSILSADKEGNNFGFNPEGNALGVRVQASVSELAAAFAHMTEVETAALIATLYISVEHQNAVEERELEEDLAHARKLADAEHEALNALEPGLEPTQSTKSIPQGAREAVLFAGPLEKRGGGTSTFGSKRFKLRWFELVCPDAKAITQWREARLTYQDAAEDDVIKGQIMLHTATLVCNFTNPRVHDFKLCDASGRCYELRARSAAEKTAWIMALEGWCLGNELDLDPFQRQLYAGWLRTSSLYAQRQGLKAKDRWVELLDLHSGNGATLTIKDHPGNARPVCDVVLHQAAVINDCASDTKFFVLSLGEEISFDVLNVRQKRRWLELIAPRTESKLVLEKNAAPVRHLTLVEPKDTFEVDL